MTDIITPMLSGLNDLIGELRGTTVITWHGYALSLYSAAISLMVFEKILSCIFAAVTRFGASSSGGGEYD